MQRVNMANILKIQTYFEDIGVEKVVDEKKQQLIKLILEEYTVGSFSSEKSTNLIEKLREEKVTLSDKWGAIGTYMSDSTIKEKAPKPPRLYRIIDNLLAQFLPIKDKVDYEGHVIVKSLKGYFDGYVKEVSRSSYYESPFLMLAAPIAAPIGIIAAIVNSGSRGPLEDVAYLAAVKELAKIKSATIEEQKEFIRLIMGKYIKPKFNQSNSSMQLVNKLSSHMTLRVVKDEITYVVSDHTKNMERRLGKMIDKIICYVWQQDDKGYFLNNGKELFWDIITAKNNVDEKRKNAEIIKSRGPHYSYSSPEGL